MAPLNKYHSNVTVNFEFFDPELYWWGRAGFTRCDKPESMDPKFCGDKSWLAKSDTTQSPDSSDSKIDHPPKANVENLKRSVLIWVKWMECPKQDYCSDGHWHEATYLMPTIELKPPAAPAK